MADPMETEPSSGLPSSPEEEEELEEQEAQFETLISGREKRSTAGRHMAALLDAAHDDDLALLFEEVEDDNEFENEEAEDEDMGLDSSSDDDDDDQGPNAQNDYEGEKQLQKEERKKRRAQTDLRFQMLQKRVKINPMVSSSSAVPAPRPKKKSERISWIPTVEDGPVRSSSRRQTMVNKEMTHARLKDSQEKRIRIIATMKEAEERKAHLKPKKMTQEDRLAEAERVERLNSKSLNRWERTEKKKAEERKARIEALQNRQLEGPVISYWSGLATWTNGRLTRVGKVDIEVKPEKAEKKKKKLEKDEKASESQDAPSTAPAEPGQPTPAQPGDTTVSVPTQPADVNTQAGDFPAPAQAESGVTTQSETTPAQSQPQPQAEDDASAPTNPVHAQPEAQPASTLLPDHKTSSDGQIPAATADVEMKSPTAVLADKDNEIGQSGVNRTPGKYPVPVVEIPISRSAQTSPSKASPTKSPAAQSEEKAQAMEIDQPATPAEPPADAAADTIQAEAPTQTPTPQSSAGDQANVPAATGSATQVAAGEAPQASIKSPTTDAPSEHVTHPPAVTTEPLDPKAPLASSTDAAPAPAPLHATPAPAPAAATIQDPTLPSQTQSLDVNEGPALPPPPPVIEHTGRNLTILENFDEKTAQSKKYSMYFNAKKPPRLTSECEFQFEEDSEDSSSEQKTSSQESQSESDTDNENKEISSSLCVITSLPSRYRDPETHLPYANSYAYKQIRKMLSQGYTWSSMLGCFVGAVDTAARGVPDRFVGKHISGLTVKREEEKKDDKADGATGAGTTAEPMEVDG
ncbi:YL1 nuclear C-terminal [Penicillium argentinense]|uniref:YL1 nuclear C-terminal n=1 Tax=Penicillium argentinense TaxID=1131581 RepID=A0A9W9FM80_9EURO|nr:YL1 nuclear C-terminal [Penicillium argentinense]KAJ5102754.1 YL1 nuclear C-terminal [Penicillium argentinense]